MANDPAKKTEQKAETERAGAQARVTARDTSSTQSNRPDPKLRRSIDDAAYNYMQDVRSAWQEYQDHISTANETFMKSQRDAHVEANQNLLQAQKDYTQSVQEAAGTEENQQRVEEAQGTYVKTVRDASESRQRSTAEAYQEYVRALSGDNDAAERLKQRLEEAYRNFVNAIQQIDV